MVGVPTSKACNTCRQRRIACSLERPWCSQCVKSNRLCTGYQRERKFIVNQGLVKAGRALAIRPQARRVEDSVIQDVAKNNRRLATQRAAISTTSLTCSAVCLANLTTEIAPRAAYCQQLLNGFIMSFVPISQLGLIRGNHWFLMIPELASPTPALQTSCLAVSTARLGRLNNDPVLVNESLRIYIQGLGELSKALRDPKMLYHDETFAACMVLTMYELLECPAQNKGGYISHQNGCSRLVQLRGPEAHSTGFGHQIFLQFRLQEILQCLDRHCKTFLTDREWLDLPWKSTPSAIFDQLINILAVAPGIFERADLLKDPTSPTFVPGVTDLLDQCWKLDADLQALYTKLDISHPGPLYWPQFSTSSNLADDPVKGKIFPVAFHFSSLRLAHTMLIYWSILLMLYQGLTDLHKVVLFVQLQHGSNGTTIGPPPSSAGEDVVSQDVSDGINDDGSPQAPRVDWNNLPPLEHRTDILAIGRNICQSVEYCMQEEMLGSGAASVVAPLSIMIAMFKERPDFKREVAWAMAVLDEVRMRGLRLLNVL